MITYTPQPHFLSHPRLPMASGSTRANSSSVQSVAFVTRPICNLSGSQSCSICGRQPTHAQHLTFAQPRGLSTKVSDDSPFLSAQPITTSFIDSAQSRNGRCAAQIRYRSQRSFGRTPVKKGSFYLHCLYRGTSEGPTTKNRQRSAGDTCGSRR